MGGKHWQGRDGRGERENWSQGEQTETGERAYWRTGGGGGDGVVCLLLSCSVLPFASFLPPLD